MTKDFCRGGKRVGAPGFLIGLSNKSPYLRPELVGGSGEDGRLKTKRPVQPQFELILVNNSPFLEEGISRIPLKIDCPALRYLHQQGHAFGGKAMSNCPLPNLYL